ncbi:MAG: hypothetical protein ABI612_10160 [Betaproteobacteria bacterium]
MVQNALIVQINALPNELRSYIHDLQRATDSGLVAQNDRLARENAALQELVEQYRSEIAELRSAVRSMPEA